MTGLVGLDRQVLALWAEHGIPADPSTLEYAQRLIGKLFDEVQCLEIALALVAAAGSSDTRNPTEVHDG